MSDKKPYRTTKKAGWFVADRRIPKSKDGLEPQVGFILELTDAEAKYPRLAGEIELVASTEVAAIAAPAEPDGRPSRRASNA